MPEKSTLDARLAEIDRRLRAIQSGLAPAAQAATAQRESHPPLIPPDAAPAPKRLSDVSGRDPAAPSPAPAAAPAAPADLDQVRDLVARLTVLLERHERLLSRSRELLGYRQSAGAVPSVSLSAGPFASTEALRRFERSLQGLPEVRSAVVREYEGADRAIVDVHLGESTP
jgi:hypothetical protein